MANGSTPAQSALQQHYWRIQAGFALDETGQSRSLVVPNGNACARFCQNSEREQGSIV